MIIFLARNNETNIEYEHWKDIEAAFKNCEKEFSDNDLDSYSTAWTENDFGNYEMWIIQHGENSNFTAKITPFEVVRIEVFE